VEIGAGQLKLIPRSPSGPPRRRAPQNHRSSLTSVSGSIWRGCGYILTVTWSTGAQKTVCSRSKTWHQNSGAFRSSAAVRAIAAVLLASLVIYATGKCAFSPWPRSGGAFVRRNLCRALLLRNQRSEPICHSRFCAVPAHFPRLGPAPCGAFCFRKPPSKNRNRS
jgi:hypothetical protein